MTATLQQAVDALTRLGCKPTKSGDGYVAFCPIHEADGKSHKPSLTLKAGNTVPVVVNCHAGCDGKGILKTLGINGTPNKSASIVTTYRYQTAEGIDVREKVRYEPKDFRIRHRDAAGNWVYKAGDGPAVLYKLPELRAAIAEGRAIFVVEGEKDADRLASLGLVATCNIEGAAQPNQRAKWRDEYTTQLSGATRVVLVPDNDAPGRAHMHNIATQLAGKVADVRWLELPGLQEKGDVSDWLNANRTGEELKRLANEAPEAKPPKTLSLTRDHDNATRLFPQINSQDDPLPEEKMAAETLASVFRDQLRIDSITRDWLLCDGNTGILKPCPPATVERMVYGALGREIPAFKNSYVVGVTKLLAHEIELVQRHDDIAPPPFRPLNLGALDAARLHPRCIVENLLYADLALVNAEGGTGKTTLLLYEAVHIALGRDLWGCRVLNPGRTLFITAEDGEELLQARLQKIMTALDLTDYERRKVCENFMVWDVTGSIVRLAELDARGNLQITALTDQIVETYRDAGLVQVIFDPVISFSPGERIVNDGEQAIVTACRRIVRSLNCCVRLIHHSGQANARNGAMDQYAGRGGTALPDGCRMVTILANANRVNIQKPDGYDLRPNDSGFVMARAKLSYAPPQPNIWIRRHGWTFDYFIEEPRNSDAERNRDADKVADFLAEELHHGRRYTKNSLELAGKVEMPRTRIRAAVATLEVAGRLEERELPADQRRGKRKTYLHPYKAAATVGGIAADMTQNNPASPPNPPPVINPPPYREINGGGIDAAFISPSSLQSAKDNGGIAAEWRNSGKSGSHSASQPTANSPTTEASGIGGTDELSQPAPDVSGQPPSFPVSRGGPVISQHPIDATSLASPLARRILQSLKGVPSGMDANELVRQAGNGKGASLSMIEHELADLAKRGLVSRINGRWVAGVRQ